MSRVIVVRHDCYVKHVFPVLYTLTSTHANSSAECNLKLFRYASDVQSRIGKKKKIKSMQAALACRSHMRLTGSHQLCLIGNLLQLAQNVLVTVHEAQNQIIDLRFLAKLSDELL